MVVSYTTSFCCLVWYSTQGLVCALHVHSYTLNFACSYYSCVVSVHTLSWQDPPGTLPNVSRVQCVLLCLSPFLQDPPGVPAPSPMEMAPANLLISSSPTWLAPARTLPLSLRSSQLDDATDDFTAICWHCWHMC